MEAMETPRNFFLDRRQETQDRRRRPGRMPASLCRRHDDRRRGRYGGRPWWLLVNYVDEGSA